MNLCSGLIGTIKILKDVQILVVDNDRDTLSLYAVLLESYGATVVVTASIGEALISLNWFFPDILICEMRFCGESVNTLTTKLSEMEKSTGSHILAIATPTWITDSLAQILDAGFEDYLLKPIDLDALVSLIKNLLISSRSDCLSVV
jgi:CheY-like chemotaxis protein